MPQLGVIMEQLQVLKGAIEAQPAKEVRLGELQEMIMAVNHRAIKESRQDACCHNEQVTQLRVKLDRLELEKEEVMENFGRYRAQAETREKLLRTENEIVREKVRELTQLAQKNALEIG
jgi:hypothetical protein